MLSRPSGEEEGLRGKGVGKSKKRGRTGRNRPEKKDLRLHRKSTQREKEKGGKKGEKKGNHQENRLKRRKGFRSFQGVKTEGGEPYQDFFGTEESPKGPPEQREEGKDRTEGNQKSPASLRRGAQ